MRFVLACLATLAAAHPAAAQPVASIAGEFINRAWGTDDGLPQNSVTAMAQTRDGYLWLGTFGGLVRFDGHAFTVFQPGSTPGLGSARIIAMHEDRNGVLWIGTEHGLTRYHAGQFRTYTERDGLPANGIASLHEDARGQLWVGTASTVARFDGEKFQHVEMSGIAPTMLSIVRGPFGEMWMGGHLGGLLRIDQTGRATVVQPDNHPGVITRSMLVDSRNRVWVGVEDLQRWDGEALVRIPFPAAAGSITAFAEDPDGSVWIGTSVGGVHRWRDGKYESYSRADGLTDIRVRSLLADRDGNVWIGTDVGGLNRLKRRRAHSYPHPGADQSIAPIISDGADGLWVGATCGGLLHFRAGHFRAFTRKDGLTNDCVWALHRDPDNTIWIGTMGGGLNRYQDGRFSHFRMADGLPSEGVHAITRTRDGALWLASGSHVTRFADGKFTSYPTSIGSVLTITQDRAGDLWLGGSGGMARFNAGKQTTYTTANGLSNNHVRAIYEDADGVLWIGTYGGGLNRFKDGRFTVYSIEHGLHDTAVSRIIEDDRGNLWMSGNKGVYRVARSQLNDFAEGRVSYITSIAYGTADGMVIDETNGGQPAGWRTADGRLWFPTIKGLVSIEPAGEPAKHPPVFIEQVIVDGQTLAAGTSASGRGRADAEFHYTAVDLGAAEKTRFRYRLAGYDRQWIEGGTRRVAFYTNIPPGEHQFEVVATNADGAWSSTPARMALTVIPFWWQRLEVQAAGLVALLLATGLGVRAISLRRARQRLAELEREQALDRERARIARDLHDDLGSRLTYIAMMADTAATKLDTERRLASATRAAVQTMDELVWAVNARNDTVEGFALYLQQFAEEHVSAAGIRCRLKVPADLPARTLGADVRRHLYLACKEAVNNAVKHAGASEIDVAIAVDGGRLAVSVSDDGRGLPPEIDPTGNGLRNYRERMDAIGGQVEVTSAPDSGTRITFSAPI